MAERKFDYNNVSTVYQNMKKITGDAGDGESIAGILHKIDEEVHNKVDVSEEAIFGDLGKQMLLDWDNTSANFDNFVTNFSNWSTLIAQSAGNYAQFEQDIAGFRQENPLGVTSGGITDAYTNTGYYSTYDQAYVDSAASLVGTFVSYNGLGYIDTNMVALEEQRKTNAKWAFGIQAVSTILSVVGLKGSGVFAGAAGATDDVARVAAGSADDVARAAADSVDDAAKTVAASNSSIFNAAKTKISSMSDDALAKMIGIPKQQLIDEAALAGMSTKEFALQTVKSNSTMLQSLSNFGSNVSSKTSNLLNVAKTKISSMSDDALAKMIGIPKQQLIDEATLAGMSTKEFATSIISNGNNVGGLLKNTLFNKGTIPTAAGLGTNIVGENLLADIDYENVTTTSSPYVE